MTEDFENSFTDLPLVAILRGLTPEEAADHVEALVEAGFRLIETPLNAPRALEALALLAARFAGRATIGAGTAMTAEAVRAVAAAGGRLIVAPNFDPRVAEAAVGLGLAYGPGVGTASEAFAALEAGASFLKLFPAEMIPPAAVKALRTVTPPGAKLLPVGGISPETMAPYLAAGASGFGLGSALWRPGQKPEATAERARAFVAAWRGAGR